MPQKATLEKIEKEIAGLSREERLKLMDSLLHQLIKAEAPQGKPVKWDTLYGMGKGLWGEDAQEYVNRLREDRI